MPQPIKRGRIPAPFVVWVQAEIRTNIWQISKMHHFFRTNRVRQKKFNPCIKFVIKVNNLFLLNISLLVWTVLYDSHELLDPICLQSEGMQRVF